MSARGHSLFVAAALSAALAVAAGAFGAHGAASPQAAEWLRTGAQYQMIHAVAVFALALGGRFTRQGWLMLAGAAIFALTLYAMALGGPRWLGAVTPVGGMFLIAAWLWIAFSAASMPRQSL
ncbi:DUF423 domain-containing protein [Pseudonocardia sp. TMWB2A]|uniref:DUF423 domain-containing protein n=1 Tax=Pseudonocardia sp. TMWB2A TaxID=687430 RepID=UPI00307DC718